MPANENERQEPVVETQEERTLNDILEGEETPRDTREGPESRPAESPATPPEASLEDRLTKALSTIETLTARIDASERQPRRELERPEPQVELEEYLGVRLPKDRAKWPVKITEQDLLGLKWNEDPAGALNTLGNVLIQFVLDNVPSLAMQRFEAANQARDAVGKRLERFHKQYPDLEEHQELTELVERRLRAEGAHELYRGERYEQEVAKATRTRIAQMRGVTLPQYEAEVAARTGSGGGSNNRPASRAVSTSHGSRGKSTDTTLQKEIDDL